MSTKVYIPEREPSGSLANITAMMQFAMAGQDESFLPPVIYPITLHHTRARYCKRSTTST